MTIGVAVLSLFLVFTLPNLGIGSMVLSPTEQVQCHSTKRTSTSLPCEGNPIGNMSAEECCSNENGNSISTSNMCLGCLLVGFEMTKVRLSPSNATDHANVMLSVRKKEGQEGYLQIDVDSVDFSKSKEDFVKYSPINQDFTIRYTSMGFDEEIYLIQMSEKGNGIALEEPLKFRLQATFKNIVIDGDFALVIAPSTVDVTITDLDSVDVEFVNSSYQYSENHGEVSDIQVQLSVPVAKSLEVFYSGEPSSQNRVVTSGVNVSSSVTFPANSSGPIAIDSFTLTDDDTALELNEQYQIMFTSSSITEGVDLGPATNITIMDDDVLTIGFAEDHYTFTEGDSDAKVQITIDHVIYHDIIISLAGESSSQSGVVNSGPSINLTRTFTAQESQSISLNMSIVDDFVGRENDEQYDIKLISSSLSADITTKGTTSITITDDDDTSVSFTRSSYTFMENAGLTHQVAVKLNREVAQSFSVKVSGDTEPIAAGVRDSGSDVDEMITFAALNISQSNLHQRVEIQIKDDDVSGEPIQQYTLALSEQPNDVSLSPHNTTTINIDDDDVSGVRFAPFEGPLLESSGTYDLTVLLVGEVSSSVSVDVLDVDGNTVRTVEFQPIRDQKMQEIKVPITIDDDEIALEDDQILRFFLSNPNGVNLTEPSTVDIEVTDDDALTVSFVSSSYNYTEDHGDVSDIKLHLSKRIANSLNVMVAGAVQGVQYSSSVMFPANTSAFSTMPIKPFSIENNNIGLEADKEYQLMIKTASNPSKYVILGQATTITVIDDDIVTVDFVLPTYNYIESHGEVSNIQIQLSNVIAQSLEISYNGGPSKQDGVETSGASVSSSVTFPANSQAPIAIASFALTDDNTALEFDEQYYINFTDSSIAKNVELGEATLITIMDDDEVTVDFETGYYSFSEGESQSSGINLMLSTPIAQKLTINVVGGPDDQPSSVVISGTNVDTMVTFPVGQSPVMLPSFAITDDDTSLETDEKYELELFSSIPSDSVYLGDPANITITDDDIATIMFIKETYSFNEGESGQIGVRITTVVAQDVIITVNGGSGSQPHVIPNGPNINQLVLFSARGERTNSIPIQIGNDEVALENLESYVISSVIVSPNNSNLVVGNTATIEITSEDVVNVTFSSAKNEFQENIGSASIGVQIDNPVARDLVVFVFGDSKASSGVELSGELVNTSVTFTAQIDMTKFFFISIKDDAIALERKEEFDISFTTSSYTEGVVFGPSTQVVIIDDDIPAIGFAQDYYTFSEGDINAAVQITIGHVIYQDITFTLKGESPIQSGVVNSGPSINFTQTFTAQGSQSILLSLSIVDDSVGRENNEKYDIKMVSSSHSADITTKGTTSITITDDDDTSVGFTRSSYTFMEDAGLTHQVAVKLNREIAQSFTVKVSGSTTPLAHGVRDSGSNVDQIITFEALNNSQSNLQQIVEIQIKDDNVSGEPIQQYTLALSGQPNDVSLSPFSNTTINIDDDDESGVRFALFQGPLLESAGKYELTVLLKGEVSTPVSVDVLDGGGDLVSTVEFQPIQGQTMQEEKVNITITDDNIALEDDEILRFSLSNPVGTKITAPSTVDVEITDDDAVTVSFVSSSYTYNESHGEVSNIQVQLSNPIAISLNVSIASEEIPYFSRITFLKDTPAFSPMPISFFLIVDDETGLEEDEVYQLKFSSASRSENVILGNPTTITIVDDDDVTVSFEADQYVFSEGNGLAMVPITVNRAIARDFTVRVFGVTTPLTSGVVDSGRDVNETVKFGQQGALTEYVSLNIKDDSVSVEVDQEYDLTLSQAPQDVTILPRSKTTIIIQDDDSTDVVLHVSSNCVTEGKSIEVCLFLTSASARDVIVDLSVDGITATENDLDVYGMKTVSIPALSNDEHCFNITALTDLELEDDENFTIAIETVRLPGFTPPLIDDVQFNETIHIIDVPPPFRTCYYNATSEEISTFKNSMTYTYSQTCERALLSEMTRVGNVGVFIDSFKGTFKTTRIGVRLGLNESIVVSAYSRTVIRKSPLNLISFTNTTTKLTISVSSLGLRVEITASGVSVIVLTDSGLQNHRGLCGNEDGQFTTRNGTIVDTRNMENLNRMIRRLLIPPNEAFIITVARRECGLLADDLKTDETLFAVPLYTPFESKAHSYSLCYEIRGKKDETYNFISDECTQVTAHYRELPNPDPDLTRPLHLVDQINITAVNNRQQCVSISVTVENNTCSTSVGGSVGNYIQHGISVRQMADYTRVSVPNCADNRLIMKVMCRTLSTNVLYLELRVTRGLNLRETSHGIIGQFWNVETNVTKYTKPLREDVDLENPYLVELMPKNKPKRSFVGFLEESTWNFEKTPCIYAGNSQGGPIYEVVDGEPNDSVIEGTIEDYSTANFVYDHFDNRRCR